MALDNRCELHVIGYRWGSTGYGMFTLTGQTMLRFNIANTGTSSGTEMIRISNEVGVPAVSINNTYGSNASTPDQNRPFVIRRTTHNGEALAMFLQDVNTHFVYTNDEKSGSIDFRIINTDTESGGGVSANDNVFMTLLGNQNGGRVGIGTAVPDAPLIVKGIIQTNEVRVDAAPNVVPDYVFEPGYNLPSLEEIKHYIDQHRHLPEVPSAKEMEANGINLGEMNMILLKKVEELTLHLIEQENGILELKKEVKSLRSARNR